MAITQSNNGSQLTVINTEHSLASALTTGIYQLVVDVSVMALADLVEIRAKESALAAGTVRTFLASLLAHAQSADDNLYVSPAITFIHAGEFTLKQTAGTVRTFPWSVRKIA